MLKQKIQNDGLVPWKSSVYPGADYVAKKPGVITLPSGLQYLVVKSGSGASPQRSDSVKVHYHGTLLDGQVFDSSVQRGAPATFGVGQVIPGWVEALQKMKVGDKWMLYIPPELAYGNRGMGPILPGSLLTFEVELLDVLPPAAAKPAVK
jgi:FKBP-type peptidyl-prolyl cis-trans isomerase FklB